AKYVVSLRNPKDHVVSMYRFMEGWRLEPGTVSLTQFAQSNLARLGEGPDYFHHLVSWWEQRDNPSVLLLSYELIVTDPVTTMRKLAAFCGVARTRPCVASSMQSIRDRSEPAHADGDENASARVGTSPVPSCPPTSG
ncbi:MAG: sulfotransferase domain-containing protein, partial [Proteobacteria bacterium]|nr:sulfotransferase domain-containing protein [Pseudomonadota bacterium]